MPTTITLKGIPDEVYARLQQSASANRRSINSEVIVCLESLLLPRRASAAAQLASIRALRSRMRAEDFDHDELDRIKREGRP